MKKGLYPYEQSLYGHYLGDTGSFHFITATGPGVALVLLLRAGSPQLRGTASPPIALYFRFVCRAFWVQQSSGKVGLAQ